MSRIRASLAAVAMVVSLGVAAPAAGQTPGLPPAPESISGLFTSTLADFRRLPSDDALTWLAVGGTIAAAGHMSDRHVSEGLSSRAQLKSFFHAGETVGGARMQLAGALATYAVGRVSGHRRLSLVGADLIRAQILTQSVTAAIKLSARRGRPDGGEFSFPSGHASVTFASATVLHRHFGWKAGIPAYAVASYVAASRVHVKRHYLSDVAFGAAVGMVAGRTVTLGAGRARFAVAPSAASGGAGVSLTLVGNR